MMNKKKEKKWNINDICRVYQVWPLKSEVDRILLKKRIRILFDPLKRIRDPYLFQIIRIQKLRIWIRDPRLSKNPPPHQFTPTSYPIYVKKKKKKWNQSEARSLCTVERIEVEVINNAMPMVQASSHQSQLSPAGHRFAFIYIQSSVNFQLNFHQFLTRFWILNFEPKFIVFQK